MISFFNRLGNTWFAKAIFVVLLISMTIFWGLGGIGNTIGSTKTAIQVGSKKISLNDLAHAFDEERAKLSQLTGQYISPAQAMELGLLQQTIQKQVTTAVNDAIRDDLGLAASDSAVRKYVERHPAFQDNLGHFDRNLFLAYLSQTRTTESQLAEQLKNELTEQHLNKTLRFVVPAPKSLAKMQWQKENEIRDVEALLINQNDIPLPKQPTEEDLKDYYEAYISDFMQPETRDILLLTITPNQLSKNIQISQDELNAAYEEQKDLYSIPEKRHIQQIRFDSQEKADAVKATLTTQNFMAKAMANGQTPENTDFGFVTRSELLPELAESAFSAKEKSIVGPIETSVGWQLILVDAIQPATVANKAKIYADIRQKLAAGVAYEKMEEMVRSLEDLLGEGKSLQEVASQLKLDTFSFKNVGINGANLPDDLKNTELLQDLFLLKEKEASALLDHGNGFVIGEVQRIQPAQPKPYSAVRSDLIKLWRTEQQKAALPDLTEQALTQMKAGNIPAKLGQAIVIHKLTFQGNSQLPAAALPNIFMQSVGYDNAQVVPLENGNLISVVKGIKQPVMNASAEPEQQELLAADIAASVYDAIVASYAEKLGVKVQKDVIQKAFSAYQNEK